GAHRWIEYFDPKDGGKDDSREVFDRLLSSPDRLGRLHPFALVTGLLPFDEQRIDLRHPQIHNRPDRLCHDELYDEVRGEIGTALLSFSIRTLQLQQFVRRLLPQMEFEQSFIHVTKMTDPQRRIVDELAFGEVC